MCGIGGLVHLGREPVEGLDRRLAAMNRLQAHRGPDGHAIWTHPRQHVGLAHRRLSIIGLGESGTQPMTDGHNWLSFNGEIYNYLELRDELGRERFRTSTDSETLLHGYAQWGTDLTRRLRGMFGFALWDEAEQRLVLARDPFGIKPLYYTVAGDVFYFASEAKALLPFVDEIAVDEHGFRDYLSFQFCLEGRTLFRGIEELAPAHQLVVQNGQIRVERYWEVYYERDFDHTDRYFVSKVRSLLQDSIDLHLRSDVEVGSYVSGGIDSSLVASLASEKYDQDAFLGFTGKFEHGAKFDESHHARAVAQEHGFDLHEKSIGVEDFTDNIEKVIYHLDFPVAGPGSFPQYMVSELAAKHRKVVLGGQGGDEIFGGYARYLIAYFEQCIRGAIEGTLDSGNFVVTYESIIPNLRTLENYKPLLRQFWSSGLFGPRDERYFQLINRAPDITSEIRIERTGSTAEAFRKIFNGRNVERGSYFDAMTHFDFKTLLPALLHVEDRMSMAHGLEARVPLLDVPLIEFAATIPSDVKFKDGRMKRVLKKVARGVLPDSVLDRPDKMGFPVPLADWAKGEARDFIIDTLQVGSGRREYVDNDEVIANLETESQFGRRLWGFLSLEIWQQQFHDRASELRNMADQPHSEPVQGQPEARMASAIT